MEAVQLEKRSCRCGNTFSVLPTSPQQFCGRLCEQSAGETTYRDLQKRDAACMAKRAGLNRKVPFGYMTTKQVAKELGFHPLTIGRWQAEGRLTCLKINPTLHAYKLEEVREEIRKQGLGNSRNRLSKGSVPSAGSSGDSPTRSTPRLVTSIGKEDGGSSPESCVERSDTESTSAPEAESTSERPRSVATTDDTRRSSSPRPRSDEDVGPRSSGRRTTLGEPSGAEETENDRGEDGMPGTDETATNTTGRSGSEGGSGTLPAASSQQQTSLDAARSATMSLIDESATLLVDCMRSAAKPRNDGSGPRDFRDLNAIANMGKQVAQLAKVKLDAIKAANSL